MTSSTKTPTAPSASPTPVAAAAKKVVQQTTAAAPATTAAAPAATPRKAAPASSESAAPAKNKKAAKQAPAKAEAKAKPAKTVSKPAAKEVKEPKPKKPKLVRDSFTIPKDEYAVIDTLKLRSAKLDRTIKKSELLRAGLKLLASLNEQQLLAALQAVPTIKTGRPKAEEGKSSKK